MNKINFLLRLDKQIDKGNKFLIDIKNLNLLDLNLDFEKVNNNYENWDAFNYSLLKMSLTNLNISEEYKRSYVLNMNSRTRNDINNKIKYLNKNLNIKLKNLLQLKETVEQLFTNRDFNHKPEKINKMKKIKYFIASAGNLDEERKSIETYLTRKNDILVDEGKYLEVIIWEKTSSSFSIERKQNDFNEALLNSDVLICIIYDKVGPFTYEEFKKAYESFKTGNKPQKIYVYFKDGNIKLSEINEKEHKKIKKFQQEIKDYEQIYNVYENIAELLLNIEQNFQIDIKKLSAFSLKEELVKLLNIINPQIIDGFTKGAEQISVNINEYNLNKLIDLHKDLEEQEILQLVNNYNTITGNSNRIGNSINDLLDGTLKGYTLRKMNNY